MYQNFNPDLADLYDDFYKWERFIFALRMFKWYWLILPHYCYNKFIENEVNLGQESLKRKMNKLEHRGLIKG